MRNSRKSCLSKYARLRAGSHTDFDADRHPHAYNYIYAASHADLHDHTYPHLNAYADLYAHQHAYTYGNEHSYTDIHRLPNA